MADESGDEPIDVRVRRRLRELRAERGLTLQQVAASAGLDVSTLSRLEQGKRRLALDHVAPLAAALGVSTDDLLTEPHVADPRVRARPTHFDDMTMWPLSHRGASGGIQAFKIVISQRRRTPPGELAVHEGHEWIYVLNGHLRLVLGSEDFEIKPGEAVEFSTWTPHWFGAVDSPVELLAIFGPQGQRVHLQG